MTLVKWNSPVTEPALSFPSLIDNFFGRDMEELFNLGTFAKRSFVPAVNISENKDNFRIEVAAPGLKKEDFQIEMEKDTLTISSERKEEKEEKDEDEGYSRREFSYQSFKRAFTLPKLVEADKISASYTDGVLNITLPKKEEAKEKPARKIEVQ